MLKLLLSFIAAISFTLQANASEGLVETYGSDLVSPFSRESRKYIIAGAAMTLTLVALEDEISDPLQKSVAGSRPLGKTSGVGYYAGLGIPNALYAIGLWSYGELTNSSHATNRAELMARASISAQTASTLLKLTVREPRPSQPNDRLSFPSGHSTAAFSFASVVGSEHAWYWGVASYSLASFVAFSRINDNRHELHDVVAGATIGISYGLSVANRMRTTMSATSFNYLVSPTDDLDGLLMAINKSF